MQRRSLVVCIWLGIHHTHYAFRLVRVRTQISKFYYGGFDRELLNFPVTVRVFVYCYFGKVSNTATTQGTVAVFKLLPFPG